jgi:integrase
MPAVAGRDLDFEHRAITVRSGKGGKDRVVTLPDPCMTPLQRQLNAVHNLHDKDLLDGFGAVWLPHALTRKYPQADRSWGWQYVFTAARRRSIHARV